jgi:hypothetical protein
MKIYVSFFLLNVHLLLEISSVTKKYEHFS